MKLKLHTTVIYNGKLSPAGSIIEVTDMEHLDLLLHYGEIADEKTVKSGEKSCVEPPVTDAKKNKATTTPSNKARSAKKK